MVDPEGFASDARSEVWEGVPFPTGIAPSPKKIFHLNGVFWCILSGTFLSMSLPEKC